jgi:hypothetical protein
MLVRTKNGLVEVRRAAYWTDRDFYAAVRFYRTT